MFKPGREPIRGFLTDDSTTFSYGNVVVDDYRCKPQWMYVPQSLGSEFV